MKTKTLIVCKSFFPTNGPRANRATELVKEFSRLGHDVEILTPRNAAHDVFEKQYGVTISDMGTTFFHNPKRLLFKRIMLKVLMVSGIARKFNIPDFFFMDRIPRLLKGKSYDLIVSIAKPHSMHWGVAKAIRKYPSLAKKWIADCGDPFMGNPFHNYHKKFEKLERLFCETADFIAVPIKEAIPSYYPEFRDKIKVIPQGFNFAEDRKHLSNYERNSIPTFAYAGAFYKDKRDPSALFEYLVNLPIDFRFIIYTSNKDLVAPYVKRAGERFVIKNYIPRQELLKELSKMDFLININNISSVQSPSKLIDYYLAGRPVLSLENNQVSPSIDSFLNNDYEDGYNFENMDAYDISNVANSFLRL